MNYWVATVSTNDRARRPVGHRAANLLALDHR